MNKINISNRLMFSIRENFKYDRNKDRAIVIFGSANQKYFCSKIIKAERTFELDTFNIIRKTVNHFPINLN